MSHKHSDENDQASGECSSSSSGSCVNKGKPNQDSEDYNHILKEKVFLFKVSMKSKKAINREMAVIGASSLSKFAEVITGAFNFQLDHSFGFYSNLRNVYRSKEVYTLFYDREPNYSDEDPNDKGVENVYIYNVFQPGKEMIFLFDYGDEWEFTVKCRGITEPEDGEKYPKITKIKGEAPPQYYTGEDEEDDN